MKQRSILSGLGLSLALSLLISGCTPKPVGPENPDNSPNQGPVEITPASGPDSLRIALCTSPNSIDDQARNFSCYNGIISFLLSRSSVDSITPLQETSGDPATVSQTFGASASNYDVVVCVGSAFSDFSAAARENPQTYFILVDTSLSDENGDPLLLNNVYSMTFAEQECGFLAGMTAALESQTGRVAVIHDTPSDSSARYYYGFRSGVAYTNGNYGTSAEIIEHPTYSKDETNGTIQGCNYTDGSSDVAYTLANSLIDEGCDVLFLAAGFSGNGALTAAKERDSAKVICSETDQFSLGIYGGANAVLTSITKDYANFLSQQLSSIINGSFRAGADTLCAADNAIGYVSEPNRQQLKPETIQALDAAYPMIQDGTIVPLSGPTA